MTISITGFQHVGPKTSSRAEDVLQRPRLIISTEGLKGAGKTHWALTAPGPLAFFNLDIGLEGVLHKFKQEKEIFISDCRFHKTLDKKLKATESAHTRYIDLWLRFIEHYEKALNHPEIRTIIIDTATELWELLRLAKLGRLKEVLPHQYSECNMVFSDMIRAAYDEDKNLILIHRVKQRYANEKWDGTYIRAGFKDTGNLSQIVLRNTYTRKTGVFQFELLECRPEPAFIGGVFDSADGICNFETLKDLIFPGE